MMRKKYVIANALLITLLLASTLISLFSSAWFYFYMNYKGKLVPSSGEENSGLPFMLQLSCSFCALLSLILILIYISRHGNNYIPVVLAAIFCALSLPIFDARVIAATLQTQKWCKFDGTITRIERVDCTQSLNEAVPYLFFHGKFPIIVSAISLLAYLLIMSLVATDRYRHKAVLTVSLVAMAIAPVALALVARRSWEAWG